MTPATARIGAERRRVRVQGVVQGVGFRPFVYGLARRHGLSGYVLNDGGGVLIEVEGPADQLDVFAAGLTAEAPPLARVEGVAAESIATIGDAVFVIAASRSAGPSTSISTPSPSFRT